MPRNDESRLGVQDEGGSPPIENTKSPLSFVIPTEFVELPTKGKFYPPEHPLHNVETVEIRYMTAKETDILTSKSLLKKGLAVDRMLENILVDKNIKTRQLFTGDKNALIIAARISGFGEKYDVQLTCQHCGAVSEHEFDLGEIKIKETSEEIKFSDSGTFFITLPKTEVIAECCLLTGDDEKMLLDRAEKKQKLKLPDSAMTDQYKKIIVSLNGVAEKGVVEEFVDIMPALDSTHLRKEYDKVRPDVDMTQLVDCESCDASNVSNIPFSANFFWPE